MIANVSYLFAFGHRKDKMRILLNLIHRFYGGLFLLLRSVQTCTQSDVRVEFYFIEMTKVVSYNSTEWLVSCPPPLYQWFPKCIVRLSKCSLGHLVPAKWHWIPYIIYAIVRIPLTIPPPQSLTKWHSQWEKVKWSSQIHSIATQFHLSKHLVHETPLPYPNYFSKLIQNS